MTGDVDRLQEALAAAERRDWGAVYDGLAALRRESGLGTEDLYTLGDAAWWLGLVRETIEICEECHERFVAEGRVDRAAMVALENGFHWMMRGEPEVGSGWLGRARRLLDGRPPSLGHGYLLWMDSQGRLLGGDLDGALVGATDLQRLAAELDAPVLGCFGLALQGMVTIRGGDVARGYELLDEAMLPVLAGRVGAGEAGNLYCTMIATAMELADTERARRWTELTERWCDLSSSAVMFVGICRVHRAQLLRAHGDLEAAQQAAAEACAELADLNVEVVAEGHYEIGECCRLRGDLAAAAAEYDAAAALGRVPEPGRSLLLLAEARADDAAASVAAALAAQEDPFRRARLLAAQVEIACAQGAATSAEAAATELESIAATYDSPGFRSWARSARSAAVSVAAVGDAAPPGGLTLREWEILRAVAEGLSNKEVAARLVISEKTVARHLANVFAKIGVASRTAGAAWVHKIVQTGSA